MFIPADLNHAEVLPYTAKGSLADAHPGCTYEGILTPYEQTWDEGNRRANPGEIADFVVVVLKMNCPGQAAQPVFRAGRQPGMIRIRLGSHKNHYSLWGFDMNGKAISEDGKVKYEAGHRFGSIIGVSDAQMEAYFNYQYAASTHDMLHPDSDGIPKWLPQVMTKLVKLSNINPEIQADLKLAAPLIQQVVPELAPQLAALQ